MKYEIKKEDADLQIKDILKRRMQFSTRLLRKLKLEGGVTVNNEERRLNEKVRTGDVIKVQFPQEESHFEPQDIPIETVFEDEDLLIVNKQPGVVVHPTKGHLDGTIANGLAMDMKKKGESYKIRFVNRLDMDTSGLLIIAKNSFTQESLVKQMKEGKTEKRYLAVVDGVLEESEGVIDLPIGVGDENAVGRIVTEDGYPSVTRYKVEKYLNGGRTLVSLILETGRTHQIRVHMSHIGYPVTGDSLYGQAQRDLIPRQALHAQSLSFLHPRTGERMRVEAPVPEDMRRLISGQDETGR